MHIRSNGGNVSSKDMVMVEKKHISFSNREESFQVMKFGNLLVVLFFSKKKTPIMTFKLLLVGIKNRKIITKKTMLFIWSITGCYKEFSESNDRTVRVLKSY